MIYAILVEMVTCQGTLLQASYKYNDNKTGKTGKPKNWPNNKYVAPHGNWGGFDKTEVCGNTTRNFMGPGAAGSGHGELSNL